ncbi:RidA family protein [Alcaligenes faecalis]|uniref:RidA family protein n=1 Tax=Alcaligenes faecalis TaxID=511 RepID=UPI00293285CC|nr:RidA family protein [Alcaligenes faecalis]MDV2116939.1 RidA family protein [Alcaligenes faecalis]
MRFFASARHTLLVCSVLGLGTSTATYAANTEKTAEPTAIKRFLADSDLPFSRAVQAGDFLFLSGQIPLNEKGEIIRGSIEDQTNATLDRIEETLKLAGADLSHVVKATVYLSDMALYDQFNKAYTARLGSHFPARSLVQAKLVGGVDVEIEVQAWAGAKAGPAKQ